MTSPPVINAAQLAARFGLTKNRAQQWLRKDLPHLRIGRRIFTTEALLAQWLAANLKNQPRICSTAPLDDLLVERAAWMLGELVRQGKLAVLPEAKGAAA